MQTIMQNTEPLLQARAVTAGYRPAAPILHGVDLVVRPAEIVAVLGPNGAGKSTLVKAIAGLISVNSGSIRFRGRDLADLAAHRRVREGLIYVPQSRNVFARLSVEDNLKLGALHDPGFGAARQETVLELFPDLRRRMSARAGDLSGGQRQMVAIGRALMSDPQLLIVDEPSAGLSPRISRSVFDQLVRVRETGVAVLMVEQNTRAALSVADRGAVLVEGRNALQGDAHTLLADGTLSSVYLGTARGNRPDPGKDDRA